MTKKSTIRRIKDGLQVPEAALNAIMDAKRHAQLLNAKFQTAEAKYKELVAEAFCALDLPVECGATVCSDCGVVRIDGQAPCATQACSGTAEAGSPSSPPATPPPSEAPAPQGGAEQEPA